MNQHIDPTLGLLVSFVILRQGLNLLIESWRDLTDASVPLSVRRSLERSLLPLVSTSSSPASIPEILAIEKLRARRAGAQMFVDLVAKVPGTISIDQSFELEGKIAGALKESRKEISDVRVKFVPNCIP